MGFRLPDISPVLLGNWLTLIFTNTLFCLLVFLFFLNTQVDNNVLVSIGANCSSLQQLDLFHCDVGVAYAWHLVAVCLNGQFFT